MMGTVAVGSGTEFGYTLKVETSVFSGTLDAWCDRQKGVKREWDVFS
jgi:hypothetical protein